MHKVNKIIYLTTYLDQDLSKEFDMAHSEAGLIKKNQLIRVLEKNFDLKLVFTAVFTRIPGKIIPVNIVPLSQHTSLHIPCILTVPILNYIINPFSVFLTIRNLIKNDKSATTIIIYNLTYENVMPALLLKLFFNVLIITQYEDGINPNFGPMKKFIARFVEKVGLKITSTFITNSRVAIKKFEEKGFFLFRGVCDKVQRSLLRGGSLIDPQSNLIKIVFSSTLDETRGINLLISLLENANSSVLIENVKFIICGKGTEKKFCDVVSAVDIYRRKGGAADFKGFISQKELQDVSTEADIFLNLQDPSHEFSKNSFPSKIFDYLLYDRPIISTKVSDLQQDDLFKTINFIDADWESLQERILIVAGSIDTYIEHNSNNFMNLQRNFSSDKVAHDLLEFIDLKISYKM